MADKRISQLVERTTLANNDVLPIVASGASTTNKVTLQTIEDWMQGNLNFGVTSVAISVPTGLTVTGSPITSTGTFIIGFAAGYSIPTNTKQSEWDSAYNDKINSVAVTGTTTKTITLTQQDGGTLSAQWSDLQPVTSVFGRTGDVVAVEGDYSLDQLSGVGITSPSSGQVLKYDGTNWVNATEQYVGTVTSVGVSVPAAFSVTGSPITTSGTITISGAGTSAQYIDGTGSLQTFPSLIAQATNLVREVYNNSGATMTKGTVVYINGGHGNLPTIAKAKADADSTSAQTYGVVQANISDQSNGYIVVVGDLTNIDTQGYLEGTQLYLSGTTAGNYTSSKPYAPIHIVYVGIVTRSHPTQGIIAIKIQNGYEMDEIHDVSAQNPSDNDILQYKTATGLWTKTAGTTTNIAEGTNLYYTNERARQSISETITGIDYDNTTGVFSTTSGYGIPTTAKQTQWDAAYNDKINSASVSGTTTKTLTLTQQDGGTITTSWSDYDTAPVTSVFGRTGAVVATEGDYTLTQLGDVTITTPTNGQFLKYDGTTWINAAAGTVTSVALATGTTGTDVGVTGSPITGAGTITLNIPVASATNTGKLSNTDWSTFNSKEPAITAGTTAQYYRGDKTFQNFNSAARSSISLTTTGTSGAATYDSATGVLNVPQYSTDLSGYVTLGTAQTISGAKTFSNFLNVQYNNTGEPLVNARFGNNAANGIGGVLVSGEAQAHIRFLVGSQTWDGAGAKQWQIRVGNGLGQDNFKIFSWTKAGDTMTILNNGDTTIHGNLSATNLSGTNTGDQDLSGYVTLATSQTISGIKIFRNTGSDTLTIYGVDAAGTQGQGAAVFLGGNDGVQDRNYAAIYSRKENGTSGNPAAQFVVGVRHATLGVRDALTIDSSRNVSIVGNVSAANLSGTNTGDQTLAGLGGEPVITAGTTAQYWRGDKTWQNFNTAARGSISLTTTGTSGAATYNSTTGVLNIPQYAPDLSGYLPLTGGTLTGTLQVSPASGVAWYYANRINNSTEAGIQLRTNGTAEWYTGLRNAAGQTDNYHFYSYTTNTSVARITPAGQFIFASTLGNGTHTYTLPSATGTLALTSDIPSSAGFVTLATAQTITGEKIFNSTNLFRKGTVTNNVSTSAYADYNQAAAVIVGADSMFEMMGIDDNTTWRHMLTFKNINPTTGNLVSGFGFGTHMNTGNTGNNSFDRFAISWGTNVYPQDNADIMSWKPSGKVGIGETDPQTALHIKRNEASIGLLRLENTSSTGYSNIQFFNNSGVFRGSFGYINTGTSGSISGKFLWDVSGADVMIRGGNVIVGDESTAQSKLYVVDGSVTTKTTNANNNANYWYSISDANNIVRVRDTTEISINKTSGAGYGSMVVYSEVVEKNFTMDFKLVLGNPGSGYRHFAIAIPTNNTDNVNQYDYIVFRHNVSSSADNQIRVDQAGVTTLDSVGSFNPNWADGAERHVRITINDNIVFIEVNGSEAFRGTMNPRTINRGRIGFAVYESSTSSNAWAIIRNFNLQQYGNDKTSLPLSVTRNYSSLSPASIAVGSYNYSLAYGWHVRDGVVGNKTQVRSNNGVTAMGRNYADFGAGGGEAVITIPNRKAFRKVYGYVRVRGGGSTDGWNTNAQTISGTTFMDGIAITGVDTANANETWIWGIVCNNYNADQNIAQKPSFVGNNYQTFLTSHNIIDGLWLYTNDSSGRTPVKTFYFERTLSSDIVGDIRIRIMSDQDPDTNEDVGLEEFAIYVAPETASDYNNAATYNFLGDVVSTGDVIAYSDASVKENVRPIENVLTRVCQSRGVKYDRTDKDSKNNIGFIAQELEEAFPELVVTDAEGKKSVKYQNASAILFEAVKEQQKQIDELKNLVNAIAK